MASAPVGAAYISEIDFAGPAGQSLELTGLGGAGGQSLIILNANPYNPAGFGAVMEVVHLPAGADPVVLITDQSWPDASVPATSISSLNPGSGGDTLNFLQTRLLVVMDGQTRVAVNDRPLTDSNAAARYDAAAVTDWLVLGSGPLADQYTANGHNLTAINTTLGIDLLSRVADKDAGRVIARTHYPGQALDLDNLFIGTPNEHGAFSVDGGYSYLATPGLANLPLIPGIHTPEPGTAAGLVLGLSLALRRRRGA